MIRVSFLLEILESTVDDYKLFSCVTDLLASRRFFLCTDMTIYFEFLSQNIVEFQKNRHHRFKIKYAQLWLLLSFFIQTKY